MRAPMFGGQRSTASTRERALNMQKAIVLFQVSEQPISTDEISELLNFSPSGSRKYLQDLFNWGIIKIATIGSTAGTRTAYEIVDDDKHVAQFVQRLKENACASSSPKSPVDIVLSDEEVEGRIVAHKKKRHQELFGDRQIHVMSDDVYYSVRLQKNDGEGKRDPLVAALFGPAKTVSAKL